MSVAAPDDACLWQGKVEKVAGHGSGRAAAAVAGWRGERALRLLQLVRGCSHLAAATARADGRTECARSHWRWLLSRGRPCFHLLDGL